jgi:UDP-N-acetylglucosamine diphosphorylase/glucosamine-1-phosphate N-acetyltransferase
MPLPVLFEDHGLARLRPAAWSQPLYEIRCGILNTRERLTIATGGQGGFLLSRSILAGLHTCRDWLIGPEALVDHSRGGSEGYLWINARLAPRWDVVDFLAGLPAGTPDFVWEGPEGMVAALLTGDAASTAAAGWLEWEIDGQEDGAWRDASRNPGPWPSGRLIAEGLTGELEAGHSLTWSRDAGQEFFENLTTGLERLAQGGPILMPWIWDFVDWTGPAIAGDLARVLDGAEVDRRPFGLVPQPEAGSPVWRTTGVWTQPDPDQPDLHLGQGVELADGTAIDTSQGPVVLDHGVRVMPHSYLEGPLYVGPGSIVKAGTRIYGPSSFGIGNRLSGEIGETTTGDFFNKQHDGFMGHAVLGSWVNLGAMTTCSDLKNNYGNIRVDLGSGPVDSGRRFVGLLMADHAKTAIGTLFNTGTSVGYASNIFGGGMPPKCVGHFDWGGSGKAFTDLQKALDTAEIVMERRGCQMTGDHRALFTTLHGKG